MLEAISKAQEAGQIMPEATEGPIDPKTFKKGKIVSSSIQQDLSPRPSIYSELPKQLAIPDDSNANLQVPKDTEGSENFDTTQRSYMKIQEI